MQAGARDNAFVADMEIAAAQMAKQFDLAVTVRRKVCYVRLPRAWGDSGRHPSRECIRRVRFPPRSRPRLVSFGWSAGVQHDHFIGTQKEEAIGGGFQIVKELHCGNVEPLCEHTSIDDPGKIGRAAAVIDDWSGHAETGRR